MVIRKIMNRGVFTLMLLVLMASTAALAGGKPPVVTNSPGTQAEVESTYTYKVQAWDPEGDALEFQIRNRPSWLWWKQDEGRLVGKPSSADVGSHEQIRILVSDGTNTTEVGPFAIDVAWAGSKTDGDDTTSTTWKKKNAGHYVSMNRYDDHTDMISAVKPGVKGFQIRYTWRSLEPWQGAYDFSEIREDLTLAASQGMQLVVFIEDKSFNGKYPTPEYLKHLTEQKPGIHRAALETLGSYPFQCAARGAGQRVRFPSGVRGRCHPGVLAEPDGVCTEPERLLALDIP